MAVIDTSMDMPKSCFECEKKSTCNFGLWNGWIDDKRDDDCPLKSTDEMIAEIEQLKVWNDGETVIKYGSLTIIQKYCDKEKKDGKC